MTGQYLFMSLYSNFLSFLIEAKRESSENKNDPKN